jgi:hypothetical protein
VQFRTAPLAKHFLGKSISPTQQLENTILREFPHLAAEARRCFGEASLLTDLRYPREDRSDYRCEIG